MSMIRVIELDIGTGGQQSRDLAQARNMPGVWCLYGEFGAMVHLFDAGGPIDAPDWMPAGAMNGTEWCSSAGDPLAAQCEARRD